MFSDPFTLVYTVPTGATAAVALTGSGAATYNFVCTGRGPNQSTYRRTNSATNWIDMTIGRQVGKRSRYTVRLTENEIVADAMDPTINSLKTATLYVVADVGPLGTTTNWARLGMMLSYLLYDATDAVPLFDRVVAGET